MIVINWCRDVLVNSDTSLKNITGYSPSTIFNIRFSKNFVGEWPSDMIAVDSISQSASISFKVDVLKCPQHRCLYWDGPNTSDWTQWVEGFIIDSSSGKWVAPNIYIDQWIIAAMLHTDCSMLMTIFTDHDLNASYAVLESITFYWMLFFAIENSSSFIKQYFDQLTFIVSNWSTLLYPVFRWLEIIHSNSKFTDSFALNWSFIIFIILVFIVVWLTKNSSNKDNPCNSSKIFVIFKIKVLSKYINWISTYWWFCLFYEILEFQNLFDIRLLSYVLALIWMWIALLFSYWFVIYSTQKWCIWNRFTFHK